MDREQARIQRQDGVIVGAMGVFLAGMAGVFLLVEPVVDLGTIRHYSVVGMLVLLAIFCEFVAVCAFLIGRSTKAD